VEEGGVKILFSRLPINEKNKAHSDTEMEKYERKEWGKSNAGTRNLRHM